MNGNGHLNGHIGHQPKVADFATLWDEGEAVSSDQRFRPDTPCPVCGGDMDMPQHQGERCWGFLRRDGMVAFCTREEYAGDLDPQEDGMSYRHYLAGPCDCGEDHSETTTPREQIKEGVPRVRRPRRPRIPGGRRMSLFCHLGIETRKIQPLWAENSSGKHTARHLTSTGLAASRQSEPVPT